MKTNNMICLLAVLLLTGIATVGTSGPAAAETIDPLEVSYTYGSMEPVWPYIDHSGDDLVDGFAETCLDWWACQWVGFIETGYMGDDQTPQPRIDFDLGGAYDLSKISVTYMGGAFGGIFPPDRVEISFSTDGGMTYSTSPDLIYDEFDHPVFSTVYDLTTQYVETEDIPVQASDVTNVRMDFFQDNIVDEVSAYEPAPYISAWIFLSEVTFNYFVNVGIDIKPGSCSNPFNVKSKGVLPVAIFGTSELDVNDIDIASIRLAGIAPIRSAFEDIGVPDDYCDGSQPDGDDDLILKFKTQDIVGVLGDVVDGDEVVLTLTATLTDGTSIKGEGTVIILKKGKKGKKGK